MRDQVIRKCWWRGRYPVFGGELECLGRSSHDHHTRVLAAACSNAESAVKAHKAEGRPEGCNVKD